MKPLLTVVAFLFSAATLHAADVNVKPSADGGFIDISASAFVVADVDSAWRVLTDYDRYSEFLPDLHVSRVRERTAAGAVVEQRGDARFLFLRQPIEVTFAVTESAPRSVRSVAMRGSFREFEGRYDLVPVAGGVRFTYTGRLVPGDAIPAWLTAVALKRNVEQHFRGLAAEMARQAEYRRLAHEHQTAPLSN
jgi:ribosome-associated toxin RatA of RatAB toxin-antitoxin module